ncbi:tyrosine-type recombinase/integrase [Oceanimonas smirnovii]|uniref:tyrosine-type recombinase/integrase n=1 Tax=Oceanimonas smirnovii TaxID=264574 RepID=UPI00376F9A39
MDNPLILPASRQAVMAMLGREHRQAKRQQRDEQILRAAISIVRRHLPGILRNPPDARGFDEAWPEIEQSLQENLKSEGAYRHAYGFLCKQLEAGNRKGLWLVQVPPPYITLRRRRPARTLTWQHSSRLIAEAEHHWSIGLQAGKLKPDELFARLLLSMVLYGGLCRPALWPALAQALTKPRPLKGNSECCWLVLERVPDRHQASNLYIKEPETGELVVHCEVAYVPDTISLGLLRQFLKQKPSDWQPPGTPAECLALLNQELGTHVSKMRLAYGGITVTEHQKGIELPQVLVEYATGRQPSASLPYCYWQRLLQPALLPCQVTSFEQFTTFPLQLNQQRKKQANHSSKPYLITQLRELLTSDPARYKSKRAVIHELRELSHEELALSEATLVNWLLEHLEDRDNALSTAKRYFDAIAAEWLTATADQDLLSYCSEDFHDLYLSILNRPRSQQDREYRAGRLEDLHLFGAKVLGFPPLPEPLQEGSDVIVRISSAVVDEPLFSALLRQFQSLADLGEHLRRTYLCFLIIAYRTGLRPGEIAKLRLCDIEPSAIAWLFVRNNRYGSNKTEAALRKVPLYPLLLEKEYKLVSEHIGERRLNSDKPTQLLFHQPENPYEPLDTMLLSLAVRTILGELSGGLYYRLYHLRHSALSRLQLLLHEDYLSLPEAMDALLPYSVTKRRELRILITGQSRLRDRYSALAVFAGHSSPDTTLSTYLHFTDVLLGLHLRHNQRELNAAQAQALLGLRPFRISQLQKEGVPITPAHTADYIRKRLSRYITPVRRPKAAQFTHPDVPLPSGNNSKYEPMLAVLSKIQVGYDHREIAWFYQLSTEQIEEWHQSALALRALTTEKQLSRLFPRSRRHQLLPPEPVGVAEKRDVAKALAGCRKLYQSPQGREKLDWLISYTLTHCNSSRSGIRFDDAETFRRYMAVATQLFDWPRWRLQLRHTDKSIIKRWHCGPLSVQPYPMKQKARFEQGSGWLTLRHQEENDRKEQEKAGYASHSLRIVLHRLAIILFRADDIAAWQAWSIKPAKEG